MEKEYKELAVAALKNGTVIDHIPADSLFQVVKLLGVENLESSVTIGYNLDSKKLGKKGIIKIADVFYPEETVNRLAIIAPNANVNEIHNYQVVKKFTVALPDEIVGIVKCNNPKCITNNEPMKTKFHVVDRKNGIICCHYCERTVNKKEVELK